MANREELIPIIERHGITDYCFIDPSKDIVTGQWVRFHCMFGCPNYGTYATCPTALPSLEVCRELFSEYSLGILIHTTMPYVDKESSRAATLALTKQQLALEREIFLNDYRKVLLLGGSTCKLCAKCTADGKREDCVNKAQSRPSLEAMGIDVYQTARNFGFPIRVLKDYSEDMNRYSILLIE